MPDNFRESVLSRFSFLERMGFTETDHEYLPSSFGNAYVDFASTNMLVRVVRDRGQITVELGSCQDRGTFFDLDAVLRLVGADDNARRIAADPNASLDDLAAVVECNEPRFRDKFSPVAYDATKNDLTRLMDGRLNEWLK